LTGDLVEKFREGRSHGWFWRQALIAIAIRILSEAQRHWPHFSFAVAGTAMPAFFWKSVEGVPAVLHWSVLPWPWSQLVLELSGPALLALAALPVLGAALVIIDAFRSVSLIRTGWINLALIVPGKYLLDCLLVVFPWLLRPVPGNPYLFRILMLPPVVLTLLFFFTFLVSAWLGCLSPRHGMELETQAKS
jgi:hypothetical protein